MWYKSKNKSLFNLNNANVIYTDENAEDSVDSREQRTIRIQFVNGTHFIMEDVDTEKEAKEFLAKFAYFLGDNQYHISVDTSLITFQGIMEMEVNDAKRK